MKTNWVDLISRFLISYLEENVFNKNHKSLWSCCQYRINMNMIYENRRRSASNDPFTRAFLWLLCFVSLHERHRYSELFWSLFSRIRTEYGDIVRISTYSVELRENTDQKNIKYGHFSRSLCFDLWFCSLLNTRLYFNNIESHTEKKWQILLDMWGSVNRQSVWEHFWTIFWVDSTWFLNVGLREEAVTYPLYSSCLSARYKITIQDQHNSAKLKSMKNTH